MAYVCQKCKYIYKGDVAPEKCPRCHAPAEKFIFQSKPEREDEDLEDDMEMG